MSEKKQQNSQPVPMNATPPSGRLLNFSANSVPPIGSGRVTLAASTNVGLPVGSSQTSSGGPSSGGKKVKK